MKHLCIIRSPAQDRSSAISVLTMLLVLALSLLGNVPASAKKQAACLYAYEWIHAVRVPLQPDPHAAYSYVLPSLPNHGTPVGFIIDADFPYSAWFSWTIYGKNALPEGLKSDREIIPDLGNTNPFVTGNPVFAPNRHYRMLIVPSGATVAPSLASIPNLIPMPTDTSTFAIAYRVYQAFKGYNQGGSGGLTKTPFPSIYAVNYETGNLLDCTKYNSVPPTIGRSPTDTPDVENIYYGAALGESISRSELEKVLRLLDNPTFAALQSHAAGYLFAPEIDQTLVTFTRPPLAPGADISSVPPPDNCSGYLGALIHPDQIALIRIPHVASIFETAALTPNTLYPDIESASLSTEGAYISMTMYGASVGFYEPGDSKTASQADAEFNPDSTGGSTIVIWPRGLPVQEREQLFYYARRQAWTLIRGGLAGPVSTANLLLRLKGANPYYYGGYTPVKGLRTGVPCYFDDKNDPNSTPRWTDIANDSNPMKYVATFHNLGNAAPQGVHCTSTTDVLSGACLSRLKAYIQDTGGMYFNLGNAPPH
jgi:hypothetical protein